MKLFYEIVHEDETNNFGIGIYYTQSMNEEKKIYIHFESGFSTLNDAKIALTHALEDFNQLTTNAMETFKRKHPVDMRTNNISKKN